MGRTRELETLRAARNRVVLVVGEAGIGKSTLVGQVPGIVGRAVADEGAPDFWPWLRVLDGAGLSRELLDVDPLPGESRASARFRAIARCADELRRTETTIVLEDLHWADEASTRLLRHLSAEDSPTIIATSREVIDLPNADVIRLGPLSLTDVAEYAGPAKAEELLRRSGGNPLYLRLLSTTDAGDAELAHLVQARLAPLSTPCRNLLERASVVGEDVDLGLVDAEGLDEAIAAGLLADDPDAPHSVRWSHALLREAVYDALPRRQRIDTHRDLAAKTSGTDRARHLLRGGGRQEALRACQDVGWFERALPLAETDADRAELHLAIADQAYQEGLAKKALDHCAQAADLGDTDAIARAAVVVRGVQGDAVGPIANLCARARERLGDEDSARHAKVLAQHATVLAEQRGRAHITPLSARALAMAERSGDTEALMLAMQARQLLADVPEQLALGTRMVATGRPEAALWGHTWRIDAAYRLGAIDQVDVEITEVAGLADRMRWPLARWHVLRAKASRAELIGRFAESERLMAECFEIAKTLEDVSTVGLYYSFMQQLTRFTGRLDEYPIPDWILTLAVDHPIFLSATAQIRASTGDRDGALILYERLLPMIPGMPDELRWPSTGVFTAQTAVLLGDLENAAVLYDMLLPLGAYYANQAPGCDGAINRTLGVVAAALGRHDVAERHLTDAIAMEKRIGALPYLALAQFELAKISQRPDELLESALHLARRLGMKPLVAQIEARTAIPLTAREKEIALFVADGLANRTIAERLVLSERTVETHVRNLLLKLGLENRTQVAGWVVRSGLTWSH